MRLRHYLLALLTIHLPCFAQVMRDPLIGTVTAPKGAPCVGIMVEAWRAGGRGTGFLDLDYKNDFRRIAVAKTGRDGRFAMHLPVGLPCRIIVDHKPHAVFLREDCLPGEDISIQLVEPAIVTGIVKHADGTPAKAKLRGWHRDLRDEVFRGETDKDGRFCFDRVAPGPIRIEVEPARAPSPNWLDVPLEPGQTFEYDLALKTGVLLKGRVLDADTGEPIAGARIGEGWTLHRAVTTKADGTFEMPGFGSDGYGSVHCKAKGYVKSVKQTPKQNKPLTIEFEMTRGLAATGRIVGEQGKPMKDVYVQVFGSAHNGSTQHHDCVAMRTAADGKFRLAGLKPGIFHVLVVRKDGFATLVYALPEAQNDVRKAGDVVLPRPRLVRGLLTGPDGKPKANTPVSIWGYNDDRHRMAPNGPLARGVNNGMAGWGHIDMYVGRRKSRTDQQGRFAFGDIGAGSWHVVAYDGRSQVIGRTAPFKVNAKTDPPVIKMSTDR